VTAQPPPNLASEDIAFVRSLVIHEDAEVLALDKPAGLSSQGGRIKAHTLDDLLWAFVKPSGRRPVLVHRLDRDTSGVILAARSKPAAAFLGKALMARRFRKTYLAVVARPPEPASGAIDAPLRRVEEGREAYMRVAAPDHPDAEPALTRYRTLLAGPQAALLELEPVTGRMHQLRVHLAHLGRPIVGDPRYGGALTLAGQPVPRLMLHAARLSFPHPVGGTRTVVAPLPRDIESVLKAAGLRYSEDQSGDPP
jgi:tRNA pseudouridine32 synthase/23S rRNA pseudouridine746 synthase